MLRSSLKATFVWTSAHISISWTNRNNAKQSLSNGQVPANGPPTLYPIQKVGHLLINEFIEPKQLTGFQGLIRDALGWLLAQSRLKMESPELHFQESHRHVSDDAHANTDVSQKEIHSIFIKHI